METWKIILISIVVASLIILFVLALLNKLKKNKKEGYTIFSQPLLILDRSTVTSDNWNGFIPRISFTNNYLRLNNTTNLLTNKNTLLNILPIYLDSDLYFIIRFRLNNFQPDSYFYFEADSQNYTDDFDMINILSWKIYSNKIIFQLKNVDVSNDSIFLIANNCTFRTDWNVVCIKMSIQKPYPSISSTTSTSSISSIDTLAINRYPWIGSHDAATGSACNYVPLNCNLPFVRTQSKDFLSQYLDGGANLFDLRCFIDTTTGSVLRFAHGPIDLQTVNEDATLENMLRRVILDTNVIILYIKSERSGSIQDILTKWNEYFTNKGITQYQILTQTDLSKTVQSFKSSTKYILLVPQYIVNDNFDKSLTCFSNAFDTTNCFDKNSIQWSKMYNYIDTKYNEYNTTNPSKLTFIQTMWQAASQVLTVPKTFYDIGLRSAAIKTEIQTAMNSTMYNYIMSKGYKPNVLLFDNVNECTKMLKNNIFYNFNRTGTQPSLYCYNNGMNCTTNNNCSNQKCGLLNLDSEYSTCCDTNETVNYNLKTYCGAKYNLNININNSDVTSTLKITSIIPDEYKLKTDQMNLINFNNMSLGINWNSENNSIDISNIYIFNDTISDYSLSIYNLIKDGGVLTTSTSITSPVLKISTGGPIKKTIKQSAITIPNTSPLQTKVWINSSFNANFNKNYPELTYGPDNNFLPRIPNINNVSFALSGDSTISTVGLSGFYRGMNAIYFKDAEEYVSTNNYGSLFYSVYLFKEQCIGKSLLQQILYSLKSFNFSDWKTFNFNNGVRNTDKTFESIFSSETIKTITPLDSIIDTIFSKNSLNNDYPVCLNSKHSSDFKSRNQSLFPTNNQNTLYPEIYKPFWLCNKGYSDNIYTVTPLYSGFGYNVKNKKNNIESNIKNIDSSPFFIFTYPWETNPLITEYDISNFEFISSGITYNIGTDKKNGTLAQITRNTTTNNYELNVYDLNVGTKKIPFPVIKNEIINFLFTYEKSEITTGIINDNYYFGSCVKETSSFNLIPTADPSIDNSIIKTTGTINSIKDIIKGGNYNLWKKNINPIEINDYGVGSVTPLNISVLENSLYSNISFDPYGLFPLFARKVRKIICYLDSYYNMHKYNNIFNIETILKKYDTIIEPQKTYITNQFTKLSEGISYANINVNVLPNYKYGILEGYNCNILFIKHEITIPYVPHGTNLNSGFKEYIEQTIQENTVFRYFNNNKSSFLYSNIMEYTVRMLESEINNFFMNPYILPTPFAHFDMQDYNTIKAYELKNILLDKTGNTESFSFTEIDSSINGITKIKINGIKTAENYNETSAQSPSTKNFISLAYKNDFTNVWIYSNIFAFVLNTEKINCCYPINIFRYVLNTGSIYFDFSIDPEFITLTYKLITGIDSNTNNPNKFISGNLKVPFKLVCPVLIIGGYNSKNNLITLKAYIQDGNKTFNTSISKHEYSLCYNSPTQPTIQLSEGLSKFYIGEIIHYIQDLDEKQMRDIENYLLFKWNFKNILPLNESLVYFSNEFQTPDGKLKDMSGKSNDELDRVLQLNKCNNIKTGTISSDMYKFSFFMTFVFEQTGTDFDLFNFNNGKFKISISGGNTLKVFYNSFFNIMNSTVNLESNKIYTLGCIVKENNISIKFFCINELKMLYQNNINITNINFKGSTWPCIGGGSPNTRSKVTINNFIMYYTDLTDEDIYKLIFYSTTFDETLNPLDYQIIRNISINQDSLLNITKEVINKEESLPKFIAYKNNSSVSIPIKIKISSAEFTFCILLQFSSFVPNNLIFGNNDFNLSTRILDTIVFNVNYLKSSISLSYIPNIPIIYIGRVKKISNGNYKIYLEYTTCLSKVPKTNEIDSTNFPIKINNNPINIGQAGPNLDFYFDEFTIYDRALNDFEIPLLRNKLIEKFNFYK